MTKANGRGLLAALALVGLVAAQMLPVRAQPPSVLSITPGQRSGEITVLIDQATVLESQLPFAEVSIANPEIANVQPVSNRTIYVFGQARGTTSLTLFGANGELITNVLVNVQPDISQLKARLGQLLPRQAIAVHAAADGIVLSGTVSGAAVVDRAVALARAYAGDAVINMMTVGGTQQVMLKVKVAEISRNAGKELGVSLGLLDSSGDSSPLVDTGRGTKLTRDGATGEFGFQNLWAALGAFSGSFGAIFNIADSLVLDVQLDALESNGFARTLSEPNLVALSGTEASFLAGGEVPIPVVGDEGQVTVSFKPVGVNLGFRPVVLNNGLISVSVSAEVSQVDPTITTTTGGIEVPGFRTRRATTTVELHDGQAFAIAGLLQQKFQDSISQVPWLGDIPVMGALFRSTDYQRGQTELVIFVSVHLVTPVDSEADLVAPTDQALLPSETELFLFGRTTGDPLPGIIGTGFDGAYGYVVE